MTARVVTEMLDIWPALPIVIRTHFFLTKQRADGADNAIAAMKQSDRVCENALDDNENYRELSVVFRFSPWVIRLLLVR